MPAKQRAHFTSAQQAMVEVWEKHMAAEFQAKSLEATLATMTADPSVNHVPVLTGGVGRAEYLAITLHLRRDIVVGQLGLGLCATSKASSLKQPMSI